MTPINHTTLTREGFCLVRKGDVFYYEKEQLRVINDGTFWHICDIDGNIGNTYVDSIEQLYAEAYR